MKTLLTMQWFSPRVSQNNLSLSALKCWQGWQGGGGGEQGGVGRRGAGDVVEVVVLLPNLDLIVTKHLLPKAVGVALAGHDVNDQPGTSLLGQQVVTSLVEKSELGLTVTFLSLHPSLLPLNNSSFPFSSPSSLLLPSPLPPRYFPLLPFQDRPLPLLPSKFPFKLMFPSLLRLPTTANLGIPPILQQLINEKASHLNMRGKKRWDEMLTVGR